MTNDKYWHKSAKIGNIFLRSLKMEKICLNVGKGEDVRKNWWIKKIS